MGLVGWKADRPVLGMSGGGPCNRPTIAIGCRLFGASTSLWGPIARVCRYACADELTAPLVKIYAGGYLADAFSLSPGKVNSKTAPRGSFPAAVIRPPCASTMDRQIERPIPIPAGLVV